MKDDKTSIVVDVVDRLGINIVIKDGNDEAGIEFEVEIEIQEDITVRIKKQRKEDMVKIDDILLVVKN